MIKDKEYFFEKHPDEKLLEIVAPILIKRIEEIEQHIATEGNNTLFVFGLVNDYLESIKIYNKVISYLEPEPIMVKAPDYDSQYIPGYSVSDNIPSIKDGIGLINGCQNGAVNSEVNFINRKKKFDYSLKELMDDVERQCKEEGLRYNREKNLFEPILTT